MRSSVAALGLFCIFVLTTSSMSDIPKIISYQGKVTDGVGNPVSDGTWPMRFRIYNAPTGGTLLWDSGPQSVLLSGGVFSVVLGESPPPAVDLVFDADYWLQVYFDYTAQNPRQPLGSVGYAYMASGLVPGTEVSGTVSSGVGAAIAAINSATAADASGLYGYANGGAGVTHGVYGVSNSPDGQAIFARAIAGSGETYGVYSQAFSPSAVAVFGEVTATSGTNEGVYGKSNSPDGRGVYGLASATTGWNLGVYGETSSTSGDGVHGTATATAGYAYGVWGESSSPNGRGVYGVNSATTGDAYGGFFTSSSDYGTGVHGVGSHYGGSFEHIGSSGTGVVGFANSMGSGVWGSNDDNALGDGVSGSAWGTTGEVKGVSGWSASTSGSGVYGWTSASTGSARGVYGSTWSPSGHGVYYSGGLAGTGSKSCAVKTSQGPTLLYCQESPECWFEDFGEGQLVNGRARVELDGLFLETVTIDDANPMKVFVELGGDCEGVYVERSLTGFDVIELRAGSASVPFVYRVVAKRREFEAKRLDVCEAALTDDYLYPELKELRRSQLEERRSRMEQERRKMEEARVRTKRTR